MVVVLPMSSPQEINDTARDTVSDEQSPRVLLYYKFVHIEYPLSFQREHLRFCKSLNLKGRVYVAHEGLNGTVAGSRDAIEAYKAKLAAFEIHWKEDIVDVVPFAKLKVKVRPYILNFGSANSLDVAKAEKGRHLEPKEWRELLDLKAQGKENFVLLDVRNKYESDVGHFEGALKPELESFSDFPKWVQDLKPYKDQKVLMYCTGGIRCEKFSAFLKAEGFQDVNQLFGGIINYVQSEGSDHWKGRCFVFDDRLSVKMDDPNATPLTNCQFCETPEDRHINCSNMECNKLFIICDACAAKHEGACSQECQQHPKKRPFDAKTFRVPFRKKGIVFPELGSAKNMREERLKE